MDPQWSITMTTCDGDTRLSPDIATVPAMSSRDVERDCTTESFVTTLRRLADALEAGESFRIQVAGKRFTVPAGAELSIEHEAEDGDEELELQLKWKGE